MEHHDPWRAQVACAGMDPDRFAPWGVNDVDVAALETCAVCPVRRECHDAAHANGSHVWTIHGGELPHQWAFKGAHLAGCGHCGRPLVVGGRAVETVDGAHFCNNRCRYRHAAEARDRAAGQVSLFDEAVSA